MKTRPFQLCTASLFICAFGLLALTACRRTETTWSAQSKSPDGAFVALAHTWNTGGGFGTSAQYTEVQLKQTFKGAEPVTILTLDEGPEGAKNLQMNWITNSHLAVSYQGNPTVLFEAVKAFGLDISLQHTD